MYYPRILIIENNAISYSSNNGRTLADLLSGWPKECLAQFCVSIEDPNYEVCDNFFCVTDRDALAALIKHKKIIGKVTNIENAQPDNGQTITKTPFTQLLRNIVWNCNAWRQKSFYNWIETFNPGMLLLMNGDSTFMLKIALSVAKRYQLPMVVYNCEGYYFFDRNIRQPGFMPKLSQRVFIRQYRKQFEKIMEYASHSVHLNDLLKKDYDEVFRKPSETIYNSSSLSFTPKQELSDRPKFSYLGTFYFDRYKALIEIAEALQHINPEYKLDVYGSIKGFKEAEDAFEKCKGINYCGNVPYDKVVEVIHESDMVLHVEAFDDDVIYAIRYGFSTKIADSLSSGTNFFAYAPENVAFMHYLRKHDCAWTVTKKEDLENTLKRFLEDEAERKRILNNAEKVAKNNHKVENNSQRFQNILLEAYEDSKKTIKG